MAHEFPKEQDDMAKIEDEDCALTLDATETCKVCGVWHGDPCPGCEARGFHRDGCPRMAASYLKIEGGA